MTEQEIAKKALPYVQAMAEGRIVEYKVQNKASRHLRWLEVNRLGSLEALLFSKEKMRISKPPKTEPKIEPWASVEEMGEAVSHWFKKKGTRYAHTIKGLCVANDDRIIGVIDEDESVFISFKTLMETREHSSTPWIADSWKPCGRVVG